MGGFSGDVSNGLLKFSGASAVGGTLSTIVGCMFSGKTTELLRLLSTSPSDRTAAFKHAVDRRYLPDAIVSHGGLSRPAIAVASARELAGYVGDGITVVGIDEAHFFDHDLLGVVQDLVGRGMDVIITALDLNSWGCPFPVVASLVRRADRQTAMSAVCAQCGSAADHTQRITPIVGGDLVGGSESFEPRCRECWRPPPEPPPA